MSVPTPYNLQNLDDDTNFPSPSPPKLCRIYHFSGGPEFRYLETEMRNNF